MEQDSEQEQGHCVAVHWAGWSCAFLRLLPHHTLPPFPGGTTSTRLPEHSDKSKGTAHTHWETAAGGWMGLRRDAISGDTGFTLQKAH